MLEKKAIISSLEKLGLSSKEGEVYYELVKFPFLNGSQIAKKLSYPRPTVYDILTKLLDNGYILSTQEGERTSYSAVDYKVLLKKIKKDLEDVEVILEKELKEIEETSGRPEFFNLNSEAIVMKNISDILNSAEEEVYINTNLNLENFNEIFLKLKKKKVRIILTTTRDFDYKKLGIENYYREGFDDDYTDRGKRIYIVVDMKKAIVAGNSAGVFTGTYSENIQLINMVAQAVHEPIYLMKLEKHFELSIKDFVKIINIKTKWERPRVK